MIDQNPENFVMELDSLENPAQNNEGLYLTQKGLESLMVSRFPEVEIFSIKITHHNGTILTIELGSETSSQKEKQIRQFIENLKAGYTEVNFQYKDAGETGKEKIYIADTNFACTDSNFKFSVRDSEFWFDNVQDIYAGKITENDLCFFEPDKTKCYMDFSVWQNEMINIRSNVLLYDKIYISFPLGKNLQEFFDQQHLQQKDLDDLVESGKLVIFLPNTESRYDRDIIERLYSINPNAIVSKRGINALLAIFYCEQEQKYMAYWGDNEDILEDICMSLVKVDDKDAQDLLQLLIWPIKAKNESFDLFSSYSPLILPKIGINRLFEEIFCDVENKEKINFEFTVHSSSIHIASALQATYFPFHISSGDYSYSDYSVAAALGSMLNSYQYMFPRQCDQIERYDKTLKNEELELRLLQTNNSVDMKHFLYNEKKYKTTETLKNILSNLVSLDGESRKSKISEYNNLIAEIGEENTSKAKKFGKYILTSTISHLPLIENICSIKDILVSLCKVFNIKDCFITKRIEEQNESEKDNVYLLDKLSRIAKISI